MENFLNLITNEDTRRRSRIEMTNETVNTFHCALDLNEIKFYLLHSNKFNDMANEKHTNRLM